MRDPNFMSPMRVTGGQAGRRARRGTPRAAPAARRPGGRPPSAPSCFDPDLRVLVADARRLETRLETSRAHRSTRRHSTGDRRAVDVHVERRQKDRDLPPLARRAPRRRGATPACITVPSAGARTSAGSRRRLPLGIAKEQRDRDRQHEQHQRAHTGAQPRRHDRGHRGSQHEGPGRCDRSSQEARSAGPEPLRTNAGPGDRASVDIEMTAAAPDC